MEKTKKYKNYIEISSKLRKEQDSRSESAGSTYDAFNKQKRILDPHLCISKLEEYADYINKYFNKEEQTKKMTDYSKNKQQARKKREIFSTTPKNFDLGPDYEVEARLPVEATWEKNERGRIQVVVTEKKSGSEYYADLVSQNYIKNNFRKMKKIRDYADGSYFPGKNKLIVRELTVPAIKKVLEHIVENGTLEDFFKRIK